jgi:hypothetical protein
MRLLTKKHVLVVTSPIHAFILHRPVITILTHRKAREIHLPLLAVWGLSIMPLKKCNNVTSYHPTAPTHHPRCLHTITCHRPESGVHHRLIITIVDHPHLRHRHPNCTWIPTITALITTTIILICSNITPIIMVWATSS